MQDGPRQCWCGETFDGVGAVNGYPMSLWLVYEHHAKVHESSDLTLPRTTPYCE